MGIVQNHRPVILIAAVISRYEQAFDWSHEQLVSKWGDTCLESPRFDFVETDFYESTMGTGLKKQFWAFENLIDPAAIASTKLTSNELEAQFAESNSLPEERPLNIDPGYVTEAKLVLVTTKDRDHRIYLQHGIFAEVTLHYHNRLWQSSRWTYPDYQRADFQEFFSACRQLLRQKYRSE